MKKVLKPGAVNRVYSDSDTRSGNHFTHAFVLPKGTDISRINVNKIPFRIGLNSNERGKNGEPIDLSKIGNEQKKQVVDTKLDKVNMELVDLLEVFRQSLPSKNKDVKSRMENKKVFNAELKKGANYEELLKVTQSQRQYLKLIAEKDALMNGKTLNSLNGAYMSKNDYKAASKLELMAKTRINKNAQKR